MQKEKKHNSIIIDTILEQLNKNRTVRASLMRASNPNTEHYSYQYLARYWGEHEQFRENRKTSLETVCTSLARKRVKKNGTDSLAHALRKHYTQQSKHLDEKNPAHTRLRRLLACTTSAEANKVVRKMLPLLESDSTCNLDYVQLFEDLMYFGDRVKERWALRFYKQEKS